MKKKHYINFVKKNNISLPQYKILEKDLNLSNVRQQENYWITFYKNNGWIMFNIAKYGSLGGSAKIWNKKKLQNEVNKYETRYDFQKFSNGAYQAAVSKKILDELFKNHPNNGYTAFWQLDRLQKEVDKYKTRKEFREKNLTAYKLASRKKILDELFNNHINQGYIIKPYKNWTKK